MFAFIKARNLSVIMENLKISKQHTSCYRTAVVFLMYSCVFLKNKFKKQRFLMSLFGEVILYGKDIILFKATFEKSEFGP